MAISSLYLRTYHAKIMLIDMAIDSILLIFGIADYCGVQERF
jgi:hypothetical protein